MKVKCDICGIEFDRDNCILKVNKHNYCSNTCRGKGQSKYNSVICSCDNCGKQLNISKYKYNKSKHHFCDKKCNGDHITNIHTKLLICNICGKEFRRNLSNIKSEIAYCSTTCQGIARIKYQEPAFQALLRQYKDDAKSRNLIFDLSDEEFKNIISKPCFYCMIPPSKIIKRRDQILKYTGIDRWDNNRGYTWDNVVPCCTTHNKMKLQMSGNEFLLSIKRIAYRFGELLSNGEHFMLHPFKGHIPAITSSSKI